MLPSLAEFYGKGDYPGASELLSSRLKSALFLTIPSAGIMAILNMEVIKAIFQWSSAYRDIDALRAGQLLTGYSVAIITHSVVFIMNQAFYAIGKTKVPLVAGCIGLISNPLCCSLLMPSMGAYGLTLSYSITSILQMTVLCVVYCRNKDLRPRKMLGFIIKSFFSLILMMVALFVMTQYYVPGAGKISELIYLAVKFAAGFALYFVLSILLKVKEAEDWLHRTIRVFVKSK